MRTFFLSILIVLGLIGTAYATTYAHVETGQALDPQEDASAYLYLKRYYSEVTKNWHVEQVPDSVEHNATYNGATTPGSKQFQDGTKYLNPDWTDGDGAPVAKPPPDNP